MNRNRSILRDFFRRKLWVGSKEC